MRYYYKTKDGSCYWSLRTPDFKDDDNIIEITKEEFNEHLKSFEQENNNE